MNVALTFGVVALLVLQSCKPYHAAEPQTSLKSDEGEREDKEPARDLGTRRPVADEAESYRELELADCPPELCTPDTESVALTPEGTDDLVASAAGRREIPGAETEKFALAGESFSLDDVTSTNASLSQLLATGGIDGLRTIASIIAIGNALSKLDGRSSEEKLASAAKILTEQSGDLYRFFRDNLVSSTTEGKLKIIQAMIDALPKELLEQNGQGAPKGLSNLSDAQTRALIQAARRFAGRDGYLNRGDAVRILPVVPRLVGEVADGMIQQGMQQGIAQLAAQHPFVYRRWMRRPNGIIGRIVNRKMGEALAQAEAQKYSAMRQAGAATQRLYEQLMGELGISRHFLDLDAESEHWDPDTELSTYEVRELVRSLTGLSVEQIGQRAMAGGGAPSTPNPNDLKQMIGKFRFPDGVPVSYVIELLDAYSTRNEVRVPSGLDFRMGAGGTVEVVRHRERCECYFEPQVDSCIVTFQSVGDQALRYYPGSKPANGTCGYENECHVNFVKGGRSVNLMKACGRTLRMRDSGDTYVYPER